MTKAKNPLAAGLTALTPTRGGVKLRVLELWGDEPEVLEAIRVARRDNGLSYNAIARYLTSKSGHHITANPVQKWLNEEGIA
jgi:hypothetical protein